MITFAPTTTWLRVCTKAAKALAYLVAAGILLFAVFGNAKAQTNTWFDGHVWDNPSREYRWYPPDAPVPAPEGQAPTEKAEKPAKPLMSKKLTEFKKFDEIQKYFTALREQAVLKPTPDNIKEYYKFQMQVLDQSSTFADASRRVLWANSELDYSTRRPVNNFAVAQFNQNRTKSIQTTNANLAKTHGLLFFYRSDCPYCHSMVSTIKAFTQRTGMDVLPIATDNKPMKGLPNAVPNNGMAEALDVQTVPALFLVERKSKAVTSLGAGVMALSELLERIHITTTSQPGEEF
jgi:conjugal transfer pilus assembly protein TraF